jgi:Zn/Cd-binding protein ZinT
MKDTKKAEAESNKILQGKKRGYVKGWMEEIEQLNIQNEDRKFYQAGKWMTIISTKDKLMQRQGWKCDRRG